MNKLFNVNHVLDEIDKHDDNDNKFEEIGSKKKYISICYRIKFANFQYNWA